MRESAIQERMTTRTLGADAIPADTVAPGPKGCFVFGSLSETLRPADGVKVTAKAA